MILLDTNAVIWLLNHHPRCLPVVEQRVRLYISPVTLLELKYLFESGRLELIWGGALESLANDPRWVLDNPGSHELFRAALDIEWTRDPFDRLLVAHAKTRRFRFATGDRNIKAHLSGPQLVAL